MRKIISGDNAANEGKIVSQTLLYPDGVHRIVAMRVYEWGWVKFVEDNGYPLIDVLDAAITLAHEFPTHKGYDADVIDKTRYMLMVIRSGIYEEQMGVTNAAY